MKTCPLRKEFRAVFVLFLVQIKHIILFATFFIFKQTKTTHTKNAVDPYLTQAEVAHLKTKSIRPFSDVLFFLI